MWVHVFVAVILSSAHGFHDDSYAAPAAGVTQMKVEVINDAGHGLCSIRWFNGRKAESWKTWIGRPLVDSAASYSSVEEGKSYRMTSYVGHVFEVNCDGGGNGMFSIVGGKFLYKLRHVFSAAQRLEGREVIRVLTPPRCQPMHAGWNCYGPTWMGEDLSVRSFFFSPFT